MTTVSVLIPTFNRPKWLIESINSVLHQDVDAEILVLDNGSGPDTGKALDLFDCDPRVKRFRVEENLPTGGYQFLASRASGKYAVLFADDDRMLPGNLKRKVEFLESHPDHGLVCSSAIPIGAEGAWTGVAPIWMMAPEDIESGATAILLLDMNISMPSVVFRSEYLPLLDKIGPFGLVGDWAFFLEIAGPDGSDAGFISEPLIENRVHGGSDTSMNGRKGGFFKYYPIVWRHWIERGIRPTEGAWEAMRRLYLGMALEQYGKDDIGLLAQCVAEFNELQKIEVKNG